ncbi:MAG: Fic family protein [Gammaproteobacteria bacterium]
MLNASNIEPMLPAEGTYPQLIDLATDLVAKSNMLAGRLHPIVIKSVGNLVRSMNCYYSNLIEGHDTHPLDIEKALSNDFSNDIKKRELQLEAKAHIEVQRKIDFDIFPFSISSDYILWLHHEFCAHLPDDLLIIEDLKTRTKRIVEPGQYRNNFVQVGQHIPPAPDKIPVFITRFIEAYNPQRLTKIQQIIAVAASHHRLLWIHPFLDSNGRVTRLFSHAFLRHIGIGSSLWSISRGLARSVDEYRARLMAADSARHGDLDGRGALSAKELYNFCQFFLECCLDQINYMENLIEPTQLSRRIEIYVKEEIISGRLPKGAEHLLREALITGEIERGQASNITGYQERQARTILNALVSEKLLISDTPKSAVRLNFPISIVERWFPRLYPISTRNT